MVKIIGNGIYSDLITSYRLENFYNGGVRDVNKVTHILIHGTAGTTLEPIWKTWEIGSNRQASANYVCAEKQIIGCLGENYVAWHSGGVGTVRNENSIGVEHLNSYIGNVSDASTYMFSPQTIETGCQLVADICKRLNIIPSEKTILPHRAVSSTACPQTLDMGAYIKRVKEIYNGINENKEIEGVLTMKIIIFLETIGEFIKDGHYLFNFDRGTYNYIENMEELKYIKQVYFENNGKHIPEEKVSKKYPAHIRYIEGFNLVNADKK